MTSFLELFRIRRGHMVGGMLDGPNCREFIKEGTLLELQRMFGEGSVVWTRYLRAIRCLHSAMVQKELVPNYVEIVDEFNSSFEDLHTLGLSETLKVHILGCHVLEYFEWTQETMHDGNDEAIESCIKMVNKRDHLFNTKNTKNFTTPYKRKKLRQGHVFFNGLNKQFKT